MAKSAVVNTPLMRPNALRRDMFVPRIRATSSTTRSISHILGTSTPKALSRSQPWKKSVAMLRNQAHACNQNIGHNSLTRQVLDDCCTRGREGREGRDGRDGRDGKLATAEDAEDAEHTQDGRQGWHGGLGRSGRSTRHCTRLEDINTAWSLVLRSWFLLRAHQPAPLPREPWLM